MAMEGDNALETKIRSCTDFFQSFPPPDDLEDVKKKAQDFLQKHQNAKRPVVLITVSSFVTANLTNYNNTILSQGVLLFLWRRTQFVLSIISALGAEDPNLLSILDLL